MTDSLIEICMRAFDTAGGWERTGSWVMDRSSYDRLRAEAVTEDQETARAQAHAAAWLNTDAVPPHRCPACGAGGFADMGGLTDHVIAMADPANREPAAGDIMLGLPVEVRDGAGEPHLEPPP